MVNLFIINDWREITDKTTVTCLLEIDPTLQASVIINQVFVVGNFPVRRLFIYSSQGAERKTRDEERRAAKRKMTATGRKKIDELYHPVTERSEFYGMQDVAKPPVLFTPSEDMEGKLGMDLQSFYGHDAESFGSSGGGGGAGGPADIKPFLLNATTKPATPTLKFHNHFPPDVNT